MVVESPNKSTLSPLKFFNRTAKINQEGPILAKEKLTQIDGSLKKILSVRQKSINITRIEEEQTERVEKENKLEADKFFVKGVGKLASKIPGKNTVQKFLTFMAFGWLFNTFSKYFEQLSGPLSSIIVGSSNVIDAFSKIAFGIFDGFVTFIDIGYKTWDVIRGTEDSQKLQSAMNNVLLDIDSFFGGVLSLLGIVEQPPEEPEPEPQPSPGSPRTTSPGAPRTTSPGAPTQTYTGGALPSQMIGSRAGDRVHPITGKVKFHAGNDYPMPPGTAITVLKEGKVTRSEVNGSMTTGYGNLIEIEHLDGSRSVYAHLLNRNVSVGDSIKPGTVIGNVGSTGGSTGSHLHFEYDNPNGQTERSWQIINSKADQTFRFGDVKPSLTYKLALKNGKEGVIINGKWRPQRWTKKEKERYERVHGQQQEQEQAKGSLSGSDNQRALLDMLAQAEGTLKSYGTVFGGKINRDLEQGNLTVREVIDLANSATTGSGATGRYQFMPDTLQRLITNGVLRSDQKFTPQLQDKAAVALIRGRGVDPTKPLTKNDIYRLGGEWASLEGGPGMKPGGSYSYNGRSQVKYSADQALAIYEKNLKSISRSAKSSPTTSKPPSKPERWATDPRGWFGMKGGGIVEDIPKQNKKTDTSPLSTYPSYSEGGTVMLIQPIIIKSTSKNQSRTLTFPVPIGVNNSSMPNLSRG